MRIIGFIFATLIWAFSAPAMACSCIGGQGTVADFMNSVDAVFIGYVERVSEPSAGEPTMTEQHGAFRDYRGIDGSKSQMTTFRVVKNYKGAADDTVSILSVVYEASCGKTFASDLLHLVRAKRNADGILATDLCLDDFLRDADIIKYLETGADSDYPNREICYVKIGQAYDAQKVTGKFELEPNCGVFKHKYDSIYRVKD